MVASFEGGCGQFERRLLGLSNVLGVYDLVGQKWACGASRMLVLTEHISCRLADHQDVKLEDCLVILEESLHGFREIAEHYNEYFLVSDRLIILNASNEVKVWMHSDPLANHPERSCLRGSDPEQQMVDSILSAVERHCPGGRFPEDLQALLAGLPAPLRFNQLIARISEFDITYDDDLTMSFN